MEKLMSNFPTSLDDSSSIPNPSATDNTNSPSHSSLHSTTADAVKAVEAKLGIGASTPTANTILFGTDTGESTWGTITSAQLLAVLSDETGTGSAVFANTPTLNTPKVDTINENTPGNGVSVDGLNIKDNKLNTNDSVVTANITNSAVTTDKLGVGSVTNAKLATTAGEIGAAWQSWTPTLTNLTTGTTPTTNYAKYRQIGKTIEFRIKLTLGGASISGVPRFTLPVAAAADYVASDTISVSGQLNDATALRWNPVCQLVSVTEANISYWNSSANIASISSTAPFTWAINDQIILHGFYEAA
jgi:hypothetical protein